MDLVRKIPYLLFVAEVAHVALWILPAVTTDATFNLNFQKIAVIKIG